MKTKCARTENSLNNMTVASSKNEIETIVDLHTLTKRIARPLIEIRDNQVGMTFIECDEQDNKGDSIRLSWDDLYEFGIEDWMIRAAIKDEWESGDEFFSFEWLSVFRGVVEVEPTISFETFRINPEIAEKLHSAGYEIITGRPTQFVGSGAAGVYAADDDYIESIPENYFPEPVQQPDNPDMYLGSDVEDSFCPISHTPFQAKPLIYCNPHNGAEYYFCVICKKARRKNPWHPYILGHKEEGYDEQSVLTAIGAIGDGHSVYEIAKYCSGEFKDDWDQRRVLRVCDKLSKFGKIRYELETRGSRQVKRVYLNRATM